VAIEAVLKPMNCHPIFLADELIQSHYHGYCKQVRALACLARLGLAWYHCG
jgi:hypothetical protein